ncbi:hypothetical protein KDA_40740 [Dictyobacter alpinus]|uniref:Uncharacterized protein n=1 Tax=Dictyobacter alpinus TaxID=2014873 RepID=A0A402BBD1_9CHLR|nr:hypothetical protein [Dictyobacter alpinus]GCE28590.1 hypothetical protein KDA_40740 [Dictyobacter alpinus]
MKHLPEERLLSINPLLQVVKRELISPPEQYQWAERVIRAVHAVFPATPAQNRDSWPVCQHYLKQAQACSDLLQHHQIIRPEAAELLERIAEYLHTQSLSTIADPLDHQARHIRAQLPA